MFCVSDPKTCDFLNGIADLVSSLKLFADILTRSKSCSSILRWQIVWRCDPSPVHAVMASLVTGWKPIGFQFSSSSSFRKLSQHAFTISEMTCQIRSTRKKPFPANLIAELALVSLGAMFVIFMPLQVGSACALVRTHVTREHFLAQMDVREVLVADTGSCKTLIASWTLIRTISTVTPCMALNTAGKPVWR